MLVQVDGVFAGDDILDGTTTLALLASGGLVALRRLRHGVVRVVGEGSGGRLSLVADFFTQNLNLQRQFAQVRLGVRNMSRDLGSLAR